MTPSIRRPSPNIPYRQPLRHWRYALEMTVCIALINWENHAPKIIICSDTLLDSTTGSGHGQKAILLGYTWFAMLSGDWTMASELGKFIRQRIQSQGCPSRREVIFRTVESATAGFKSSPFYDANQNIDLIVGGFVGKEPVLMLTGYSVGSTYTTLIGNDMAVVGSGSLIAHSFLSVRGHNAYTVSWKVAAYMAYEAKKYSENAPSVGPITCLDVFVPCSETIKEGMVETTWPSESDILDRFEQCRRIFGLQPINPAALPNLRYPTDDSSPQPPLPDSRGGSGAV